ncbi:MAG: hypothetical protein VW862_06065, partial [Euryarchaeota archaeon]
MGRQKSQLTIAVLVVFLAQLMSPLFTDFETPNLETGIEKSNAVGFSSGSGHELAGDSLSIDGKNWNVRG